MLRAGSGNGGGCLEHDRHDAIVRGGRSGICKARRAAPGEKQFVNIQAILDEKESSPSRRATDKRKKTVDDAPESITTIDTLTEEIEQLQDQIDKTQDAAAEEKSPKKPRRRGRRGGKSRRKITSKAGDKTEGTVGFAETGDNLQEPDKQQKDSKSKEKPAEKESAGIKKAVDGIGKKLKSLFGN